MTDQPDDLFSAVDSLLAAVDDGTVLPAPAERTRLREAAGLTEAAVAQALGVRVPSIQAWEAGRAEPKGDRREAYRRLLEGLSHRYPAPQPASPPAATPGPQVPPAAPLQRTSAADGTPADATEPSAAHPTAPAAGSQSSAPAALAKPRWPVSSYASGTPQAASFA